MPERWPALLSREEAAEYLGCSVETISRLRASNIIRSVALRDGSIIRYRRNDLDAFVDRLPYAEGKCPANQARDARYGNGKGPKKRKSNPAQEQPA